jgi:translation initiation factor 1
MRSCSRCGRPEGECRCAAQLLHSGAGTRPGMPRDGYVRLARDRKGRGGKTVTVVTGLPDDAALVDSIAQTLKRLCGTGGTVKDGVIELQGDHRERLAAKLSEFGYRVKLSGG